MTSTSAHTLSASLDKLKIDQSSKHAKKKPAVADSWEDEASDEESEEIKTTRWKPLSSPVAEIPGPPPTSPVSPSVRTKATFDGSPYQTFPPFGLHGSAVDEELDNRSSFAARNSSSRVEPDKRPEKTTSAAARLIAAGIGQRPQKRTQEQREYDQAMKVQEKKKRDAAKEAAARAEREQQKAKLAVWED